MIRFSRYSAAREYARKPLAASGSSVFAALLTTRLPNRCMTFLNGEKCSMLSVCRSPMTMSARARDDRRDKVGDRCLRVLVVAVGVHDDVGAAEERVVGPVPEGPRKTHGPGVLDDVGTEPLGDLDRPVGGPVVDDDDLDGVDPRDLPRNRTEHGRKGLLLIEARNLYDQFHDSPGAASDAVGCPTAPSDGVRG